MDKQKDTTMTDRERRLLEIGRLRARQLGDRVRDIEKWDADYSLRKAARDSRRAA